MAGDRARRHHDHRRGAPTGAALPARHGRPAPARPVRQLRRGRVRRVREGGRAGQRRADAGRARRLRQQPPDARPPFTAQGQAGVVEEPAQRRQRPAGVDSQPGRRHRPARARGPAARDRLHLQPGRLRRRGDAVPRGRRTPDDAGGARRDLPVRRGELPAPARRRPPRAGLPRLPRRAHPRRRVPPRGDAAGVQGVRRAAVRPRAVQGRLRHRDPRARHQHARPHGRHREAHQVERRGPRRHHAGGVHPAHRAGRASRASTSRGTRWCSGSPA